MVHSNVWKFEKIWLSGTLINYPETKSVMDGRTDMRIPIYPPPPPPPPPDSRQTLFNQWKQSWLNLHSGFSLTHWRKIQKYRNKFHLDERLDCVVSYIHASSITYSWSCSDYSPIITCEATDKKNPRCNELVMSYYKTSWFAMMDCFTTNQTRGCRGRDRVWRYARCWRHLTLHIINMEKNVSRLLFHFFFFLICVCIPWVWLGWRWCGCVLMYCSIFRNFTFCFYWFLFYFGLLVYICVVGVFL